MAYLDQDFLLSTKTARVLFHEIAARQPILDYHCHLSPEDIANNARFTNLAEVWLGEDHYKWRAMRAAGVPEQLITGDADPKDKFDAFAAALPHMVRNPLHHWTHLELQRYFAIDQVLNPTTADEIWERANAQLADESFNVHGICEKFAIRAIGTTDDPLDSLEHHRRHNESSFSTKIYPTYRPDKALTVDHLPSWNMWIDALEDLHGSSIDSAETLLAALRARHDFFHETGCRISDHGMEFCPFVPCSAEDAESVFIRLRKGEKPSSREKEQWMTFVLQNVGRWNAARRWVMQFHIGPLRNTNTGMFQILGPDTGYDSLNDEPVIRKLALFLDSLAQTGELPKCIFYHLNQAALQPLAVLMQSFQDGETPGKMQLGSGWWHLDTLDGMRTQMEVLSSVALLSEFVGMLTDSRSFLSFPRHEYFRRLVCRIVGADVEAGLIPEDAELLENLIRGICYENAERYFNFPR
ncbi:MAG: glucuronate isomerase [Verrucomicrobiota bacterium]